VSESLRWNIQRKLTFEMMTMTGTFRANATACQEKARIVRILSVGKEGRATDQVLLRHADQASVSTYHEQAVVGRTASHAKNRRLEVPFVPGQV
jgi:hypothetical protein